MLVKYVSIDGIPQAFVFLRFVDIIDITVHDRSGVENSSSPTPGTRKLKLRACRFSMEKARRACL